MKYEFRSEQGDLVQGWEAIVPVLIGNPASCHMACIATAFFIHTGGILVTAAHVVSDINSNHESLYIAQYIHPNKFLLRPIFSCSIHTRSDVAILQAFSGPKNKVLPLTARLPDTGEEISTFCFPNAQLEKGPGWGKITILASEHTGVLSKEHREGRDRVLLPGSCYETTLKIAGGASGGPVFDSRGLVFAVNSTGFEGADNIGYVSHIQRIGGLPVANYQDSEGRISAANISDLIQLGEILVR